jgi:hypothetical protein
MQPHAADPPLSNRRLALVALGGAMAIAQVGAAWLLAPPTTGEGDANAGALLGMWAASLAWSTVAVLLLVRYADLPDIATASMLVTIPAFAAFTLSAAFDARGTRSEINLTDGLFLGVTAGALTSMLVWGISMAVARALRLPQSPASPE